MLLAAHGFVLSAHTMVDDDGSPTRSSTPSSAVGSLTRGPRRRDRPPPGSPPASPALPTDVDLVVIGLGITGAGVALDAVTRGLSVLAVDAHDLAFGTSRWSSKLVHGGLRYLAQGQFGVAHESAVERGILMERTAPHLTHAMPMVVPLGSATVAGSRRASPAPGSRRRRPAPRGPHLRRDAARGRAGSRRPRRSSSPRAPHRRAARRLLSWDGQLEDDARLVTNVARTAASYGAHVRTRARVLSATGTGVELRDELTGETTHRDRPRGRQRHRRLGRRRSSPEVTLRPSRGTHLVLRAASLPGPRTSPCSPRCPARPTGS